MKKIAVNKKAFHDYFVIEEFEAGIALIGTEVKSIRDGKVNLKDGFVRIKDNNASLINVHISPYSKSSRLDTYDPTRSRRLLLHKKQIDKIRGKVDTKGLSVVPLAIYFNKKNMAKIKIALVKGKKLYDKRHVLKQRDIDRETMRELK